MAALDGVDALVRAVRQPIEQEGLRPFATEPGFLSGSFEASSAAGRRGTRPSSRSPGRLREGAKSYVKRFALPGG